MHIMLNEDFRDYTYYMNKGWFRSDYYYPVKLDPIKRLTGTMFDILATRMAKGSAEKNR